MITDISTENPKNVPWIGMERPLTVLFAACRLSVKAVGGAGLGTAGGCRVVSLYAAATVPVGASALLIPIGTCPYTVTDARATSRIQRLQSVKNSIIGRKRKIPTPKEASHISSRTAALQK